MQVRRFLDWRQGLFWAVVFAIAAALGGAAFVLSGVYNVAASVPHLSVTTAILDLALKRSVAVRSFDAVPDLEDEGLVRLGARHFQFGCAPCHGSPAEARNPILRAMYPAPPPLAEAVGDWSDGELAWIVRHGFKMTGMPAWAGEGRADEVWALVAFLKRLPGLDTASYRAMAAVPRDRASVGHDLDATARFCVSCHGDADTPSIDGRAPPLHGQTPAYLVRALEDYASGRRQSGIMEPIAAELETRAVAALARRFSGGELAPTGPAIDTAADAGIVARGRSLATEGDTARDIPACLDCHGSDASARFPRLQGLAPVYISGQLELFRSGIRGGTNYSRIMQTVAERLDDADIEAAAAYFGAQAAPAQGEDAPGKDEG